MARVFYSLPFFSLVLVVLPALSVSSYRALRAAASSTAELPSARAVGLQAIALQLVTGALAALAAWGLGLPVGWQSGASPGVLALTVGVLGVALLLALLEARLPLAAGDALRVRLRQVGASDPLWLIAAAAAAISEEYCYRGVTVLALSEVVGFGLAVTISAAAFGLAHFGQGWRGALFSSGFGLGMQLICKASGGLAAAIFAHFVYDVAVAGFGRRLAVKQGQNTSSASE